MRQDGEWGDQPELCAAAQCLNVNIFVHQVDSPIYVIRSESATGARDIHLSYHGGCHYNSVRTLDDDRYDSPAQHQHHQVQSSSTSFSSSSATAASSQNDKRSADCDKVTKVSQAVPWARDTDIKAALRIAHDEVDTAIEVLMSNPNGLSELQEKVSVEEDDETAIIIVGGGESVIQVESVSKEHTTAKADNGHATTKVNNRNEETQSKSTTENEEAIKSSANNVNENNKTKGRKKALITTPVLKTLSKKVSVCLTLNSSNTYMSITSNINYQAYFSFPHFYLIVYFRYICICICMYVYRRSAKR